MSKIKLLLISIGVSGLLLAGSVVGFGQQAGEPSYEVSLQLLLGSNDATQKGNLPANLSAVSQQIKSSFGMTNHRLVGTFLGRMGNSGNFESKSGLNIGQQISGQPQSFLEWNINGLRSGQGVKGYQVQQWRIQARVPVTTGSAKDDSGKERSIVNYENLGLNFSKVGFQENVPTMIGTLNLSGASETIFVIMTVKAVDL